MDAWISNNAAGLATVLAGVAEDPRFKDNLSRFVTGWSQKDPAAASDWIAQNPNLKLPDYSVRRAFEALAEHAPAVLTAKLTALPAGTVLSAALLQAPPAIRRGETVTLVGLGAGLEVLAPGEALADAADGQRLKVRNRGSRRVVEGIARSGQRVEVAP